MPDPAAFRFVPRSADLYQGRAQPGGGLDLSVAFVPPPGTPPAELTLAASWAITGGAYIFLTTPVPDVAGFAAGVRGLLASRTWAGARLLWIADPNLPVGSWSPVGITLVDVGPGGGTLSTLTSFPLRNYGCVLDGGLPLTLDAAAAQFAVTPAAAGDIRLTTDSGATDLRITTGPLTIPLTGQAAGCLCFAARLPVGADGSAAATALDVGCRFFFDDPDIPQSGLLTSRRFAILDLALPAATDDAAGAADLAVQLDPSAPLDATRTRFAITTADPVRSFYRTTLGSPVDLRPLAAELRFATRPVGLTPADADPLYLVPHGTFQLHPPAQETAPALLCGVGGAEYVELSAASVLTFAAGNAAYAPNFDPTATTQLAWPGPRLSGAASTAWAAVSADVAPGYFAQPDGAALYGAAATPSLLPFFDVRAAALPTTAGPGAAVYPLVPHASATEDLTSYERLEVQVLSQARRQVIHELPRTAPAPHPTAVADDDATQAAATPQGLLATFSADKSTWATLQIAQSVLESPPPAVTRRFTLQNVTDPLKAALLTNQQFVVVSDPTAFQAYVGGDDEIVIADYRFLVNPAQWAQRGTVLIIKNARKPLAELIADPNTWVLGTQFNRDVTATQRQLQAIVNNAAQNADPELQTFVNLLSDPAWNGVLLLNVQVPLDGLPPELAGLAAGIDPRRFQAHHVGISQTPVPADLVPRNSSLFGLISYDDSRALATTGFDFTVRSLKVRFANSTIATFRSRVAIALNQLFSVAATQQNAADNAVELDGVFQKHGDSGTYVFAVTGPTAFTLADNVLATVGIIKATLNTTTAPADAGAGGSVDTTFSFWGTLTFHALTAGGSVPLDLFSYDSLAYSGLTVRMSFPPVSPTARTFTFDTAAVAFDLSTSKARPDGFANHFPITAKGMVAADNAATPADLGLLPVDTDLVTTAVSAPWYGLRYDLNLGTVGALASKAGLVASFVVAWTPGTTGLALSVGLKLPGTTGSANAITVEGVLKITMFAVQLIYDGHAFLLKLTGIALSLFGQTLPPGATFDLFVFGDPDPAAGADSLGWYGAFQKNPPPKTPPAAAQ